MKIKKNLKRAAWSVVRFFQKLGYLLDQAWYWVRCHTYTRYHMIDIRNQNYGYTWGWIDRDQVLLLASFTILTDFVEKEWGGDHGDETLETYGLSSADEQDWWDKGTLEQIKRNNEVLRIYRWWKHERQAKHEARDRLSTEAYEARGDEKKSHELYQELFKVEEQLWDEDTQMLSRLAAVRGSLWT